MDIGESMGDTLDLSAVVEDISGDLFENFKSMIIGRQMDFGRTMFVRLYRAVNDIDGVNNVHVAWDHFNNSVLAIVDLDNGQSIRYTMRSEVEHTAQKRMYIRQSVAAIKSEVERCLRG